MKYDIENFSYGVELEYGNCDVKTMLPDKATWNHKDNTCVSSTGIANDPKGKLYQFGGEINTRPTSTIKEQISHIKLINSTLDDKIINYRSNLHIHIQIPELKNNLSDCKKLLQYITKYQQEAFDIVEAIPIPSKNLPEEIYRWEIKRMQRRLKSHQHKLPIKRVTAILTSTTIKDFYENHAPRTKKGIMWYFSPRAGINLRQMWEETETIEFRHFAGTLNLNEIESALKWCEQFLHLALNYNNLPPTELLLNYNYHFPRFEPYEFMTEQIYQWTNFDKNPRKTVAKRLELLRGQIDIDDIANITSKKVYPIMMRYKVDEL